MSHKFIEFREKKSKFLFLFTDSYIPGLVNQTIVVINNVTNQTDPDAGGYIQTSTNVVDGLVVALIALMAIDFIASILMLYGTIQVKI